MATDTDVFARINAGEFTTKLPDLSTGIDDSYHRTRRLDIRRLERVEFRAALEREHGLEGHPKAEKLFGMAWDRGHSAGLHDVAMEYEDLAELIK